MKNTNRNVENDDKLVFAEETPEVPSHDILEPWKIMIVDDEKAVHTLTRQILEDFTFEHRRIIQLNAYSGEEAMQLIQEHPDTALILLDVVMETDYAGLELIRYIREVLHNKFVRIILYTGQPGQAPERKVIREYDINDYRLKSTLTSNELYTAVISALRTYRDLMIIEEQRENLERAMEEAQIAQKARFQFLANMGHELRTPLHGILGFTELLLTTGVTDKQKLYLERIKKAGEGLCEIINNVLDLTEIIEGKLTLRKSAFSLRKMIAETMKIMAIQAQWKQLQTSYQIDDDVPDKLLGDIKRLKQILMNLIVNAIKHTESGHIALKITRFHEYPKHLLFSVSDTGIGIAKDKHEHIFQPFELGEDVITKQFAGVGLGLAISRDIIEKMNGTIWLDSEPGQGTTFYFSIEFEEA
jgi:signal transduction histidine kinase